MPFPIGTCSSFTVVPECGDELHAEVWMIFTAHKVCSIL